MSEFKAEAGLALGRAARGVGEGVGSRVQRVVHPGAVWWFQDLDGKPAYDGCVVLRGLRGLLDMSSPAGSVGWGIGTREVA